MDYQIPCQCGQSVTVPETAAGSQCTCSCGAAVAVPSLRVLRSQNPSSSDGPHPAFVLESLLKTGELKKDKTCTVCEAPADGFAWVMIDCERAQIQYRSKPVTLLRYLFVALIASGLGSFFGLSSAFSLVVGIGAIVAAMYYEPQRLREIGTDRSYRVPLCVCARCTPALKDESRLREALGKIGVYANLLFRYPDARISLN